jgi:hypothetical protein
MDQLAGALTPVIQMGDNACDLPRRQTAINQESATKQAIMMIGADRSASSATTEGAVVCSVRSRAASNSA